MKEKRLQWAKPVVSGVQLSVSVLQGPCYFCLVCIIQFSYIFYWFSTGPERCMESMVSGKQDRMHLNLFSNQCYLQEKWCQRQPQENNQRSDQNIVPLSVAFCTCKMALWCQRAVSILDIYSWSDLEVLHLESKKVGCVVPGEVKLPATSFSANRFGVTPCLELRRLNLCDPKISWGPDGALIRQPCCGEGSLSNKPLTNANISQADDLKPHLFPCMKYRRTFRAEAFQTSSSPRFRGLSTSPPTLQIWCLPTH